MIPGLGNFICHGYSHKKITGVKQILTDIKGEIDGNTIIVRDFNTPLTSMDRFSRQKINKATEIPNEDNKKI